MASSDIKIVFYDGYDVCSSNSTSFTYGEYVNNLKNEPVIARLQPRTTLTINDNDKYSNTYDDRYVVIKLDKKFKKFAVSKYHPVIVDLSDTRLISVIDLIVLLVLLIVIFLRLKN